MTRRTRLSIGTICAIACAVPAGAAQPGAIAARSKGDIAIRVTVAAQARLARLADVALADGAASRPLCLWSNIATHRATIVTASGGSIIDGTGRATGYEVRWVGSRVLTGSVGATCDTAGAPRLTVVATPNAHAAEGAILTLLVAPD